MKVNDIVKWLVWGLAIAGLFTFIFVPGALMIATRVAFGKPTRAQVSTATEAFLRANPA
jgi:hypothetical protein